METENQNQINCNLCQKSAADENEAEFIEQSGICLNCDHVRADCQEEDL
jgi:hypothetical protein